MFFHATIILVKKILAAWPFLVILVLALGLRLPLLNGSFWLDEAAQALESARPFFQQHLIVNDFQPPFLHYWLHFFLYVSDQAWWLRSWGALLPGLISIIATYCLAKKMFNKPVALTAAILLATNSLHVFLSQELRPYMWSAAWAALSTLTLWQLIQARSKSPPKRLLFIWLVLSIFGLYTSYLYPFVFLAQLIILAWQRRWQAALIGVGVSSLAFLPWLTYFLAQLNAGTTLGTLMPGWTQVVSFDSFKSIWLTASKFIYGISDLDLNFFYVITVILLAAALTILAIFFWRKKSQLTAPQKSALIFLTISLILPFLLAWLVSFFVPIIQPKRVIFLLPIFYLLISASAVLIAQKKARFALAILPLFLALNFISLFNYYTNPLLQREDWLSLQEKIYRVHNPATTVALFSYLEPFSPWQWYEERIHFSTGKLTSFSTGTYYLPSDANWQNHLASITNYETILLFDYLRDLTDPQRELDTLLQESGYREIGIYDYPNIGFVRIFQR